MRIRPNKLNIRFLVPRLHPLTAGHVPCAHAQTELRRYRPLDVYIMCGYANYIEDDRHKLNYVTVTF